jgi:aldehyde dehydrogenase
LNASQLDQLTQAAFTFKEGQGAGCPHPVVNRDLIGKDVSVLAQAAGIQVPDGTDLLFAETDENHPFVDEEQMMPFIPIVRVGSVDEGIRAALKAEHNYRHTSIIHSHNVNHMTAMARALDTTLWRRPGIGWRRVSELFHCDADRRRRDKPEDIHPRATLRDGG